MLEVEGLCKRFGGLHAVNNLSFSAGLGSITSLIGPNGAGKSTLVDILLGLLQPTAGEVLVDGIDIQNNLRSWQDHIGYVPQTIYLVDDTLARNVAFGLPDDLVDHDAVARSIKAAQLDEFVATLPDGINTIVGERGVRLSGGQRQRLAIARAILKNPPLLLLDEATSALDAQSERMVQAALERAMTNRTTLVIAHRLATVQKADVIWVLDRGRLIEQGTHAQLIAQGGLYASLAALQFQSS